MKAFESLVKIAISTDGSIPERNKAFSQLVEYFQDMAYGFAYAVLSDVQLAEDAAQEAFITAYLNLNQLNEPKAFSGWLRRIVLTECNRMTRKRDARLEPIEMALDVVATDMTPVDATMNREMKYRVSAAINALPENERAVTTLFYIDEYSQREIADFLEIPVMTVKNRLRSARKRLQGRMVEMVRDYIHKKRPSKDEQFANRVHLFAAVRQGDVDQVKTLIADDVALVNVKENMAASFLARTRVVSGTPHEKMVVDKLESKEGWSPLHWAAWLGHGEMA